MDRSRLNDWLDTYREAWRTDDVPTIGRLFSPDARYLTGPFDEPWNGLDEIVAGWKETSDVGREWEFRYEVLADTGDLAVVQGWTAYAAHGEQSACEYSNIWVIRFAPDGRAREFTEWWMERPED